MKRIQLGFIGAGNMAYAIVGGILSLGRIQPEEIGFFDVSEERCALFSGMGMVPFSSSKKLVKNSRIIFLAIKPQVCPQVLSEIGGELTGRHVLVSMMAGISTQFISSMLREPCGIVRVMPNTPLLIGCGATAMARSDLVSDADYDLVGEIFSSAGVVEHLSEEHMNAVISVNASSPAYVYLFVKAVMDGAVEQGIESGVAKKLIAQTLIGSARMILESGKEPQELIDMVTSPGGTTFQALEVLSEYNFEKGIKDAMHRCTQRAFEMQLH